jgi:hypothetical protein
LISAAALRLWGCHAIPVKTSRLGVAPEAVLINSRGNVPLPRFLSTSAT